MSDASFDDRCYKSCAETFVRPESRVVSIHEIGMTRIFQHELSTNYRGSKGLKSLVSVDQRGI